MSNGFKLEIVNPEKSFLSKKVFVSSNHLYNDFFVSFLTSYALIDLLTSFELINFFGEFIELST